MAGYSEAALAKKLGIKPGTTVVVHGAPESYADLVTPLPKDASIEHAREVPDRDDVAFVHLFATTRMELEEQFVAFRRTLRKDGVLWVSWPKKSSGLESDLTREVVREVGLAGGLVDTKVCAVDETWSGLKFLYRLADR